MPRERTSSSTSSQLRLVKVSELLDVPIPQAAVEEDTLGYMFNEMDQDSSDSITYNEVMGSDVPLLWAARAASLRGCMTVLTAYGRCGCVVQFLSYVARRQIGALWIAEAQRRASIAAAAPQAAAEES